MKRSMAFMMISLSAFVHAHSIEVFTLSTRPIATDSYPVRLCELDALDKLTSTLQTSASDRALMQAQALHHVDALTSAYDCIARASAYGLTAMPAIVIDEQFVAYGISSVKQANELLMQARGLSHD